MKSLQLVCQWKASQQWLKLLLVFGLLSFHQAHKLNILRSQDEGINPVIGYRLPRHVAPTNYKLRMWPNATSKTFRGTVEIALSIYNPTNNVTLHTNKLVIESVNLENFFFEKISVSVEIVSDEKHLLIVKTETKIPDGRYVLKIYFRGTLDGVEGFYASSLKNGGTMIYSKFIPTYARQAFPCFDEPDFKATYDITLVVPRNHVALSNMNEISRTLDNETASEAVTFATSMPMSTYVVCFVICEYEFKETEVKTTSLGDHFKLKSFAQKDHIHNTDYAQDIGRRVLEYYINYFDVPFPLPKLDMIAIPEYVSGAIEHWGLITYRETFFLVDENTASAQNKITVASTIAHELAHMWFGNLVTMKWWNDIWLNEGFVMYMEIKSLNAIEPSWTMRDQFLHHMHIALSEDVRLSSHPIVQTVDTPKQVMAMFDEVSYKKGASLIRMLEGFTGEQNFAKGVSDYLTKHKFGNADRQDLLASLEPYFKIEYPDLNLTYVMDTWTKQAGYPLLTVTKEANTYFITQSRFLLDPKTVLPKDSIFNYRWCIPITFKSDKGVNEKVVWFDDQTDSVVVTDANVNWLKLNNNQYGYYRVNYPLELWQSLIELLETKSNQLTISDRAHLLNDVFALAEAGVVPYELALKLTTYLPVEEDYVPWRTAASILNRLSDRLINTLAYDKMQAYIRHLVVPIYKKQKWEVSPLGVIERLLRTDILTLSTRAGLPAAEQNVRDIFLGWLNSHRKPVEKDLRDLVYYYGMKYASQAEWDKLWQIYNEEDDLQEQEKIRKALAAPRNTEILKKYLILAWDEVKISHQDFLMVLTYIAENPSGTALAWDFVRGRWPKLVSRYTLGDPLLASILPRITSSFSTELKLREMESFFQQYPEAGAGAAARARALENIRNNIEWIATRAPQLAAWLKTPLNELLI
ncbi:aminopeptidase A-like isoform X2 [Choristoneura fumiferana]